MSRQIGFCNADVVTKHDHNVVTTAKKIQNWYKPSTLPLNAFGVAASVTASSAQLTIRQNVCERHRQTVDGTGVPSSIRADITGKAPDTWRIFRLRSGGRNRVRGDTNVTKQNKIKLVHRLSVRTSRRLDRICRGFRCRSPSSSRYRHTSTIDLWIRLTSHHVYRLIS